MITKKIKNYFFSVDFKKAFDSIEHSYLEAGYTATAHADDCMYKQNLLKAIRFTKEFTKVSGLAMNVSKSMIINRIDNNETHLWNQSSYTA